LKLEGLDQEQIVDPTIDSWLKGLDRENTRRTYGPNLKRLVHVHMKINGEQIDHISRIAPVQHCFRADALKRVRKTTMSPIQLYLCSYRHDISH
jgi:hypothetical protein